jgi:hypothetical protein
MSGSSCSSGASRWSALWSELIVGNSPAPDRGIQNGRWHSSTGDSVGHRSDTTDRNTAGCRRCQSSAALRCDQPSSGPSLEREQGSSRNVLNREFRE